jgi:hypothetical protein
VAAGAGCHMFAITARASSPVAIRGSFFAWSHTSRHVASPLSASRASMNSNVGQYASRSRASRSMPYSRQKSQRRYR